MASIKGDGKAIFGIFIGAIIAVVFIATIADSVFTQTSTFTSTNQSVTAPAVNATLDLKGRELLSELESYNATNATRQRTDGVILQTALGSDGLLTVQMTLNDTGADFAASPVNVSYTYNPDGYLSNGGARSIQLLVVIMAALAIVIFVIVVAVKEGSLGDLIRRG